MTGIGSDSPREKVFSRAIALVNSCASAWATMSRISIAGGIRKRQHRKSEARFSASYPGAEAPQRRRALRARQTRLPLSERARLRGYGSGGGRRHGDGLSQQNRNILSSRDVDSNRVGDAFGGVIPGEFAPKPSRFDSHDRIDLGFIPLRTLVYLDADIVFFDTSAAPGQTFLPSGNEETARASRSRRNRG